MEAGQRGAVMFFFFLDRRQRGATKAAFGPLVALPHRPATEVSTASCFNIKEDVTPQHRGSESK